MATLSRGALHTPLCDLLGIRYPVCQAGMAFVARSALVAAVSEAGGLGVLAAAHCTPAELRAEIRRVRDLTDRPFGVDILFATVRGAGAEVEQFTDSVRGWVDVSLDERVPVIVAGLGSPGPLTAEAHRLGIKVMALCGNVKQARDHARSGVDVVIAQGHEAGGHTGRVTGMVLVPAVVDAVAPVPVLAAGGIVEVELLEDLAHVRAEAGDVVAQVGSEVRGVRQQLLEVVAGGVVEGEAGGAPKLGVEVLESLALELSLAFEDALLRVREHAVEATQYGERQDDVLVLAPLEGVADEIGDAPRGS